MRKNTELYRRRDVNEENRVTEEIDARQKTLFAKRKRTFAHIHVNS